MNFSNLKILYLAWTLGTLSVLAAPCIDPIKTALSKLSPKQQLQIAQLIKKNPDLAKDLTELFNLLPKIQTGEVSIRDPHLLDLVVRSGATLENSGKLPEALKAVAAQLKSAGKLPASMPPEKVDGIIAMATGAIQAELSARGLTVASKGVKYESWSNLGTRLSTDIKKATEKILSKKPKVSGFDNPEFIAAFEKQTNSSFVAGNELKLLINGPEAFAERTRLIEGAKENIHVLSWAFYDDVTGNKYADLLIKKANEGADVKVMVDGQVALQPGHNQVLKRMEENGVQVVRWMSKDPSKPFSGQHRKFILFDNKELVGGGMNFGDNYSHLGPNTVSKWRDTDVYIKGPSTMDAQKLFAQLWNEQIGAKGTPLTVKKVKFENLKAAKISLVNHQPGVGENIYRANLMAIEAAKKTIDIENAYFILDPATYKALLRAKDRGVRIRILTNSAKSVDEPIVNYPIMQSVNRLAKQGFEVYVKEGTATLHSKVLTVDGNYSWIGSHNFHPRSFRYEGEVTINVLDNEFAKSVEKMFQHDIDKAIRIKEPLKLPPNKSAEAVNFYFYDQL